LDIAVEFRERWNSSRVIGCIAGRHIHIKCHSFTITNKLFFCSITRCHRFRNQTHFYRRRCLCKAKWWRYILWFYFISLLGTLWFYLSKACKFWGKWNI